MGTIIKTPPTALTNHAVSLAQLEADTKARVSRLNAQSQSRHSAAPILTEAWTNLSQWNVNGANSPSVGGGRMWGGWGAVVAINLGPTERTIVRWTVKPGAGANIFCGPTNSTPAGAAPTSASDQNGIYVGFSGMTAMFAVGTNTTAPAPPSGVVVGAGDYFCTIVIDENDVSYSIQAESGGAALFYKAPRSAFPNQGDGTLHGFAMSAQGTVSQAGASIGQFVGIRDTTIPTNKVVNGKTMFGTDKYVLQVRKDPSSNIRHMVMLPGNYNPSTPAPVVLFTHGAEQGDASDIISDTNINPIADLLCDNGYICVSSDNGTIEGPGGAGLNDNDKFGNQAGMDDYIAAVEYVRNHYSTSTLHIVAVSMGGLFAQNLLGKLQLGGIKSIYNINSASQMSGLASNAIFGSRIRSIYSVANDTELENYLVANDMNPANHEIWQYRWVPQRFVAALSDTIADPNVHIYPLAARLAPHAPEAEVITAAGAHVSAAQFQPSDVLTFINKYK